MQRQQGHSYRYGSWTYVGYHAPLTTEPARFPFASLRTSVMYEVFNDQGEHVADVFQITEGQRDLYSVVRPGGRPFVLADALSAGCLPHTADRPAYYGGSVTDAVNYLMHSAALAS